MHWLCKESLIMGPWMAIIQDLECTELTDSLRNYSYFIQCFTQRAIQQLKYN